MANEFKVKNGIKFPDNTVQTTAAVGSTYSAGSGLTLTGTTFSHTDTSSQASVNNSNGSVIQDITLDTFGHITAITSTDLDSRYYTETESDSRFVNVSGDTMTGTLNVPEVVLTTSQDSITSDSSIASWIYEKVLTVSGQESEPRDLAFSSDGVYLYVLGNTGNDINQYTLSTPWDISTAVYTQVFSVNTQEPTPYGLFFKPDGLAFYVIGSTSPDNVYQYSLTTAWDISTASYVQAFSVTAKESDPQAVAFSPDGANMYVTGTTSDSVHQYTLSTPWNISTATFLRTFSVASFSAAPQGLDFNAAGTKMYVVGSTYNRITEFVLSTAWNISTATASGSVNASLLGSAVTISLSGVHYEESQNKLYVTDYNSDAVYQLDTATPATKLTGSRFIFDSDVHLQSDLLVYNNIHSNNNIIARTSITSYGSGYIAGTLDVRGAVDLADSDILRFGSSDDWEMYHNGTANFIDLTNGNLIFRDDGTTGDPTILTLERTSGNLTALGTVSGSTLTSTVAQGTAPLSVTSTTLVSNLNADLLDGNHASAFATTSALDSYVLKSGSTMTGSLVHGLNLAAKFGDVVGDNYSDIYHYNGTPGTDHLGFPNQHGSAFVVINQQGSTNQALILGDTDLNTGTGVLFGIGHTGNGGTSWSKRLELLGTGSFKRDGNLIWDAGNDGAGSGLDADLLDGKESSNFIWDNGTSVISNIDTLGNQSAKYRWNYDTVGRPAEGQANEYGTVLHLDYDGTRSSQLAWDMAENNLYARTLNYDTDTGVWYKFWHNANDGAGSGLDADLLDGVQGSGYLRTDGSTVATGIVRFQGNIALGTDNDVYLYESSAGAFSVRTGSTGAYSYLTYSASGVLSSNGSTVWHAGNDGAGSGLDADLLDGKNIGTSGNTVPLLDGTNTWSANQTFNSTATFNNSGNQFYLKNSTNNDPTVIHRADGSSYYILLSDAGTVPSATWNTLRPFAINQTTGLLSSQNGQAFDGGTVINEAGANADTRIEGDTDTNLVFVDASTDRVGIGTASPGQKLAIAGTLGISESGQTGNRLLISTSGSGAIINQNDNSPLSLQVQGSTALQILADGKVGIGTTNPIYKLQVNGSFAATTKSFVIDHPTKPNKKLRYGSLEGPENGVYVRGKLKGNVIELPDYWTKLVDPDSLTVQLTPVGSHQNLYVKLIKDNKVFISSSDKKQPHCYYMIQAERIDVEKLEVEV